MMLQSPRYFCRFARLAVLPSLFCVTFVGGRAGAAAPSPNAASPAAPTCESPDLFGKTWRTNNGARAQQDTQVWLWPKAPNGRFAPWTPGDANTCTKLAGDAGATLSTPAILQVLGQGPGGAGIRQMLFRLGLERLGETRMQWHTDTNGIRQGQGTLDWPQPRRGVAIALGQAQPVVRPSLVPPEALGFTAVSLSPGRLFELLEGVAGGMWPLETTLIGTQVAAWEQLPEHGLLAAEVLGYSSVVATAMLVPTAKASSVIWALPVAKPAVAVAFVEWAIEVTSPFVPALQVQKQSAQGQALWVVRGLERVWGGRRAPVYLTASPTALYAAQDKAALLAFMKRSGAQASAPQTRVARLDASAPAEAVAFASLKHAAAAQVLGRRLGADALLRAWGLPVPGESVGWLEKTDAGLAWRTLSRPQAQNTPAP